jgi:4-hydroxybenzoate polyprenyltransferase
MIHFLRLIRIKNLFIIALTMYAVRFFYFTIGGKISVNILFEQFNYFLLTLSTLFIAAAGNIINDYFDVKADKVNRPEKLVVTKFIPKRRAIIWHWVFNGIAFVIGIYLSVFYHTFLYVFIHLISINALWLYSVYFKRKFIIGNLLIASLTSLVILLSGFHFYHICSYEINPSLHAKITIPVSLDHAVSYWKNLFLDAGNFIFLLCFFAFVLNLGREIVKDMEDVEGDKLLNAKTIPIVLGKTAAKWISFAILSSVPLFYVWFLTNHINHHHLLHLLATLPVFLSSLLVSFGLLVLILSNTSPKNLKIIDKIIKLAMLVGIMTPFYWWLL